MGGVPGHSSRDSSPPSASVHSSTLSTRLGRRESRVRVPTRGGDLGSGPDTEPVAGVEVRRTDKARGGRGRGSRWHVSGRGSEGESEVFARSTIARDGGAHPTTKNLACSSPTGPGAACANLFSSSSLARVRRALGVAESRTALGRRTVGRSVRDVFDDVVSICAPTICPFPGLMPFFLAGSARSLALRTDGRRAASRRLPVGCMQPQASLALLAPCESGVRRREMEGAVGRAVSYSANGRSWRPEQRRRRLPSSGCTLGCRSKQQMENPRAPRAGDAQRPCWMRTRQVCAREKKTMDCNAYGTRGRVLAPCVRARWPWADRGRAAGNSR